MDPYLGRNGLAKNLRGHLLKGTSAVVAGGPGMGKTTLLHQVAALLAGSGTPVWIDCSRDRPADIPGKIPDGADPVIFLLDACEALLPDPAAFVNEMIQVQARSGKNIRASVWAGAVAWGEWATAHRGAFGSPIRYYPLIVLPPKESRSFLRQHLRKEVPPSEIERFLNVTGGHPYLLARISERADAKCDSFFAELWRAADGPAERFILNHLLEEGSWIPLNELTNGAGLKTPKKVLDRLASLGLIIRTLVNGAAAAKAVSPLLGEWARRNAKKSSDSIQRSAVE